MRRWLRWLTVWMVLVSWPALEAVEELPSRVVSVRLTLVAPAAQSVAVAGSFNDWSMLSHPMQTNRSDGSWSLVLTLPVGEYRFMYVVDGQKWIAPPVADDYVDDGFGQINGVLVVK